jgi:hypothetical protein
MVALLSNTRLGSGLTKQASNLQANSALGVGNVRPNYIAGGKIIANNHAGINGYVCGPAATGCANPFTVPTGANYGNAPYGALRGPGLA